MLAALLVMAGTSGPQQDPIAKAWIETLSKVVLSERASLCVDVDETSVPKPFTYPRRDGYRGLDRLAVALDRTRVMVDGVHVFRRRMSDEDLRLHSPHEHVMAFLQALSVPELSKLSQGELYISALPMNLQRRLYFAVASLGSGLGDSMVANYPDRMGMRLILDPVASMDSRTNDGKVSFVLTGDKTPIPFPEQDQTEPAPLGRPTDGTVDFGDGELLTLADLCAKAERSFKKKVTFDDRLGRTRYFISGKFTEQRLTNVLASVTEPVSVSVSNGASTKTDFADERRGIIELVFGPHGDERIGVGGLTINDVIQGRVMTIKQLYPTAIPQRLRALMSEYRIEPTDTMSISGELYLAVAAPGLATLAGPSDGFGNSVPYSVPYFIKIGF